MNKFIYKNALDYANENNYKEIAKLLSEMKS